MTSVSQCFNMAGPSTASFSLVHSVDRFSFVTIPSTDKRTFSISIRRKERILPLTHLLDGSLTATEYSSFYLDPAVLSSPIVWYQVVTFMLSHFNFGSESHYRVVDKLQSFRRQSAVSEACSWFDVDIEVHETVVVEVLPTPSANDSFLLEAFLRRLKSKGDGEMGEEESCCVCMNEFGGAKVAVEMPCSHVFHRDCIASWLTRSRTCPFCRFIFQIHS